MPTRSQSTEVEIMSEAQRTGLPRHKGISTPGNCAGSNAPPHEVVCVDVVVGHSRMRAKATCPQCGAVFQWQGSDWQLRST